MTQIKQNNYMSFLYDVVFLWAVLGEDGDVLYGFGELVGGLLGGGRPQVDPVVLQNLGPEFKTMGEI